MENTYATQIEMVNTAPTTGLKIQIKQKYKIQYWLQNTDADLRKTLR